MSLDELDIKADPAEPDHDQANPPRIASMARAIAAGATEIMAVADMPYDDRQGGIRDAHGNIWWISQRLVAGGYGHD